MINNEDEKLIIGVKSGDLNDQKKLYSKYRRILTKYINKKCGNELNLEDIVSDVLIKVFMKINTFNSKKSNFLTWVLNITNNHIIDIWRKNSVEIVYDDTLFGFFESNNTINIDDIDDDFNFICEVGNVSDDDAHYLQLKYLYGFSYDDISCYSGVSTTTISNRINYIRKKLKNNCNIIKTTT